VVQEASVQDNIDLAAVDVFGAAGVVALVGAGAGLVALVVALASASTL